MERDGKRRSETRGDSMATEEWKGHHGYQCSDSPGYATRGNILLYWPVLQADQGDHLAGDRRHRSQILGLYTQGTDQKQARSGDAIILDQWVCH